MPHEQFLSMQLSYWPSRVGENLANRLHRKHAIAHRREFRG